MSTQKSSNDNGKQEGSNEGDKKSKRRFRWLRRSIFAILALIVIWIATDFGYSTIVNRNIQRWEGSVERNDEGVLKGCEAFSVGEESADTAILLVHGINDSPHVYRKVAPYLAQKGFYCRCMRVKGFGESITNYQQADISDWLKSVDAEVKTLRKSHKKVILLGHSLGGAISIRYVSTHKDKVEALVLAAPAVDVSSQRSPILPVQYWHSLLGMTLLFTDVTQSPFGIDVLDPNEKESPQRTPFTPIKVIDQTFQLVELNRNADEHIKMPVMLCLASKDKVIDNDAAKRFFEKIPSKVKSLKTLDNSAHALLFDYQWQKFSDHVVEFAEKLD